MSSGPPSSATAYEEMGACAADLSTCVAPCAVIQCILQQCANNKDDQDEDDHNKTELTLAEDL